MKCGSNTPLSTSLSFFIITSNNNINCYYQSYLDNLIKLITTDHICMGMGWPVEPGKTTNGYALPQLSTAVNKGWGVEFNNPVCARIPAGLILCRFCTGNHTHYEFMMVTSMSCPQHSERIKMKLVIT